MQDDVSEDRILERDDFKREIARRTIEEFTENPPADPRYWYIRTTSGTTGSGPMLVVSPVPDSAGWLSGGSRRMLCYGALSIRLRTVMAVRYDDSKDTMMARVLPIDGRDLKHYLAALLADFGPQAFWGHPSYIARVAAFMDDGLRAKITQIRFGGELFTRVLREFFTSRFANAWVQGHYMSNECGVIVKPSCNATPPNWYHPKDDVTVEIVDTDESGAGELIMSKPLTDRISVKRYRTGDIARMHGPCACGEQITFELTGRKGHDYIKLSGALLRREEFDRVACMRPDLLDDYRVIATTVIDDEGLKGKLILEVYCADANRSAARAQAIEAHFLKNLFLTPSQTLGEIITKRLFVPLEVSFTSEPFPLKYKTVKLSLIS